MNESAPLKTDDYEDTPEGWAERWQAEMDASDSSLEKWHKSAEKCIDAYLDEKTRDGMRLNLYASSVNTREAMLYGKTPTVDVARRFNDSGDDDGRVAGEILQRHLNGDIERPEDGFQRALRSVLNDWLRVGFGNLRWRYVRETEATEAVPAKTEPLTSDVGQPVVGEDGQPQMRIVADEVPAGEKVTREDVEPDYVFWKDQRWSPARTFAEVRWWAFPALLSEETCKKQFGEKLPMEVAAGSDDDKTPATPWARSKVWEIWDKEHECVWFWCKGVKHVLKKKGLEHDKNGSLPDPLELKGFWPFPEPLFSNLTTMKLVPRPDYAIAQDIYKAIDDKTERIDILSGALKASGVYDKTVGEFQNILKGKENKLVAAENFVALAEKGGIANCIAWLPLEAIVAAMDKLRESRTEDIGLLFQVTGDSDIMRGQAMAPGTTATEQAIKAKFASVRMQRAQDEFARFASDAQRIRGEIICRQFDPQTILERANVQGMADEDKARAQNAVQILKSQAAAWRIVVKPDSISLTDYAANRQEAGDQIGFIGGFLQAITPMVMQVPGSLPFLLEILQSHLAQMKGGDRIESILDRAVEAAEKALVEMQQQKAMMASHPPPPDPKLQAAQVKAGAEQFKAQAGIQQTGMDLQVKKTEHLMDMQKLEAEQRKEAIKAMQPVQTPGGNGAPA